MASRPKKPTVSDPQEQSLAKPSNTPRTQHESADPIADCNASTNENESGHTFCEPCSNIDFKSILSDHNFCPERVIAISTVGAAIANKTCPSCRLVVDLVSSLPDARFIPPESQITLRQSPYSFKSRIDPNPEAMLDPPKCIRVGLCTHKVKKDVEKTARKCREIGSLLPMKKNEALGNAGSQGLAGLFTNLQYEGVVHARSISRTVDVGLLRAWMNFCNHSHSLCDIAKSDEDGKTALRLIDVLDRRVVESNLCETYVALSYVWGKGKNRLLTRSSANHFHCRGSLTPDAVPRIFADAMELVAALGERYLWVDTACIVQDDDGDKHSQLPIMGTIYSHAKLTIIAAVDSAHDPLPRWNKCHHRMPLRTESLNGVLYTTGRRHLEAALSETAWSQRGWTFQEGLLARRALIFTDDLVYWNCREESWCEDKYTEFQGTRQEPTAETSLFGTHVMEGFGGPNHGIVVRTLCTMGTYMEYVQDYSKRSLSNCSDIVWAFLGILKSMKKTYPRGYIWALPYDHLDAALLWQSCCAQGKLLEHRHNRRASTPLLIPSWCWIGKGCKAWYEPFCCSSVSRVTWHEPIQYSSEYDSSFGNEDTAQLSEDVSLESSLSEPGPFDFALLHFTAQTTFLSLELDTNPEDTSVYSRYIKSGRSGRQRYPRVSAHICLPSGRKIGQVRVPIHVFHDGIRQFREFVLLSESSQDPLCRHDEKDEKHASEEPREEHWDKHEMEISREPALNVMLVEWIKTRNGKAFAIRVALGKIELSAWDEVEAVEKHIILG